ncbi:MAG: hypothetical protein HFJ19_03760 [Clostridia bacterium]|nr:hypothetical protein [Clostridia bacterium]
MLSLILVVSIIVLMIYRKKSLPFSPKKFECFYSSIFIIALILAAIYGIMFSQIYFCKSDVENYIKCHEQASELENIIQKFDSPSLDFTDEEINIIIEELSEKKSELEKEKLPDEEKIKFYRFLIYFG